MDHPAQQEKPFEIVPYRTQTSKAQKTLLVALTAGIILGFSLLTLLYYQDFRPTLLGIAKAAALPAKTPASTSTSLVKSSPETPGEELYQKGMYALINRQFQEAINSFAELQTSNPEMLDKIDLAYAEALLGLADTLRKSDPQQAITLYRKAIQFDPRSVRAHFHLGMALTWQKKYSAAIVSYEKAIELNPYFPDTFFNLGFLYTASKNYAAAVAMYTRTVALQPDYLDEALFNLALAQSKLNDKEQSLTNLKKALSVNPNNQAAQNYLKQLQGGSKE